MPARNLLRRQYRCRRSGQWLHIAVAAEDTDAMYQAALNAGATSHMEPNDIVIQADNPLPARIAFVRGLNSELIEIFCEK